MNLKKLERYLPVNLLGPGPRLINKRIYRAAVSQSLRNTRRERYVSSTHGERCVCLACIIERYVCA